MNVTFVRELRKLDDSLSAASDFTMHENVEDIVQAAGIDWKRWVKSWILLHCEPKLLFQANLFLISFERDIDVENIIGWWNCGDLEFWSKRTIRF